MVHDHIRLMAADHGNQFIPLPFFIGMGNGSVPPDKVDFTVVGHQFPDLFMDVISVLVPGCRVLVRTFPIGGDSPIHHGIVKADLQVPFAARLDKLGNKVSIYGRLNGREVGNLTVPETESVMMPRRQIDVFHAGLYR